MRNDPKGPMGTDETLDKRPLPTSRPNWNDDFAPVPGAEKTFEAKVQALADLILEQSRKRIAAQHSQWQADAEKVEVKPGPKYTKIDRGPQHNMSGMLMIENATGEVYGIKGYGKVHKGHHYGNLDTTGQWYWGEYYPRQRATESQS
jgi:hypothetical protein